MTSKKYRKKPIVIEAYQTDKVMYIDTLEGTMKANVGDYIITGVNGEQYPCKPDIFEQTYEPEDLKEAKSTRLNGWISVKDRLPEEYKEVLAYDSEHKEIVIAFYDSESEEWTYGNWYDGEITHWQPLPELPEVVK